jgi:hypothetical protein
MDSFPSLKQSPCSLKLNYTLKSKSSKSTKSTKSKKYFIYSIDAQIDTQREINTNRLSLSPKKSKISIKTSEIAKLEEELDSDEISLKIYEIKELNNEKQADAEINIYGKYIENVIQCINNENNRLGRSLLRGWKGYQKALNIYKSVAKVPENKNTIKLKDFCAQFSGSVLAHDSESQYQMYLNSLHNLIKGASHMNLNQIISKLKELDKNLQTVEVPSLSSTPEIPDLDFTDTIKVIHTKLKANVMSKLEKPEPKSLQDTFTQTSLKSTEVRTIDNIKLITSQKDVIISELYDKITKYQEIEILYQNKLKQSEEQKTFINEYLVLACPDCKLKIKNIDANKEEIISMQKSNLRFANTEIELEKTKGQLKDTFHVIYDKDVKIRDLSSNVNELTKEVTENKLQTSILIAELEKEQKLKIQLEEMLKQEIETSKKIKKTLEKTNKTINLLQSTYENDELPTIQLKNSPVKAKLNSTEKITAKPEKTQKLIFEKYRNESPLNRNNVPTSPMHISESYSHNSSPDTKRIPNRVQEKIRINDSSAIIRAEINKKGTNIIRTLNH